MLVWWEVFLLCAAGHNAKLQIVGGEAVFTVPFAAPCGSCFLSTEVGSQCSQLQNTEGAGLGVPEGGMLKKPNVPTQL